MPTGPSTRTVLCTLALAVIAGLFLTLGVTEAGAATPGDRIPKAQNGVTYLFQNDGGTNGAGKVWQSSDGGSSQLTGSNAFAIYNADSVTAICGWSAAVTVGTGFPIAPGITLSVDIVCQQQGGCPDLYCFSSGTAMQLNDGGVSGMRWMQVK